MMSLVNLSIMLSNIYEFRAGQHTCEIEDASGWKDAHLYSCAGWAGFDCYESPGYTVEELLDVREHCRRCCGLPITSDAEDRSLIEYLLIGGTLGARSTQFDVNAHGWVRRPPSASRCPALRARMRHVVPTRPHHHFWISAHPLIFYESVTGCCRCSSHRRSRSC